MNNDTDCNVALIGTSFSCSSTYSTCGPLELEFTQEGTYELCLTEMDNGCDNNSPSNYCFNITVEIAEDQDWGSFDVCELELPFFNPPPHPNTGEQWLGALGSSLVTGLNTFDVEDDCDCNYTQMLTLNVLPLEPTTTFEFEVCSYNLTSVSYTHLTLPTICSV